MRLAVVPRVGGLAHLTPLGGHLRGGPDLNRDMAGHDGEAVRDKAGAGQEDGAGERGEGAQDVWGGLRRFGREGVVAAGGAMVQYACEDVT
jgi:hypothetical protein